MPLIVANCPRCGANRITFDVLAGVPYRASTLHGERQFFEIFCCCRECDRTTIFVINQKGRSTTSNAMNIMSVDGSLNKRCNIMKFINYSDISIENPPEHLPENIKNVFNEAARSYAIECWNAAGCMFRTSVDLATKDLLQKNNCEPDQHTRRSLARRIYWLFENGFLSNDLLELSSCIKEDGNDAAHTATLRKEDAEDLLDFTFALLERIYTIPMNVEIAEERRKNRRMKAKQ